MTYKLTTAEEILECGLNSDPQIFHRSQPQEPLRKKQIAFINKLLSQILEVAAQTVEDENNKQIIGNQEAAAAIRVLKPKAE